MNTALIILLMYFSLLGADIHDPHPVTTVRAGVEELNQAFPDWEESYKLGEWDCSDMSSFVCTYFQMNGFNAEMQRGVNAKTGTGHAWVVVDDTIIECTDLKIKHLTHSYTKRISRTDTGYKTTAGIDWWNSTYIQGYAGEEFINTLLPDSTLEALINWNKLAYTNDKKGE